MPLKKIIYKILTSLRVLRLCFPILCLNLSLTPYKNAYKSTHIDLTLNLYHTFIAVYCRYSNFIEQSKYDEKKKYYMLFSGCKRFGSKLHPFTAGNQNSTMAPFRL